MDFFNRQASARRRSGFLFFWMIVAVALVVLAVNAGAFAIAVFANYVPAELGAWTSSNVFRFVTLASLVVIGINMVVRHFELRAGGDAVAEMLHARPIDPGTRDLGERQLMNVVEEMAIASGTPPPTLWLLEQEKGINAMVAGYRPGEAAMIVTRGALDVFNREELQGVVGHEFSHILNGDMRLNVKLIAMLSGILAVGIAGKHLLSAMFRGAVAGGHGRRRWYASRSRGDSEGVGGLLIVALGAGLVLVIVGYIGTLAGRVIKASVSRQREFLADASAVQFTRSSDGIANALWKIQQHSEGALVAEPRAEEAAHMFFGDGLGLSGLFATHPPLGERIKAIDPRFVARKDAKAFAEERESASADARASVAGAGAGIIGLGAAALVATAGTQSDSHVNYARGLLAKWPQALLDAVHHPREAPSVVYALLLSVMEADYRSDALAALLEREGGSTERRVKALMPAMNALEDASRLPLLELCLPALRRAHQLHRDRLLATAVMLVRADRRQTVFEFALLTLLEHHLGDDSGRQDVARVTSMTQVEAEVRALLTTMARAGAADSAAAKAAFRSAANTLGLPDLKPAGPASSSLEALPAQLVKLAGLAYLLKQPLLEACAAAVMADGEIHVAEAELLRAVAATLDCPIPPILDAL